MHGENPNKPRYQVSQSSQSFTEYSKRTAADKSWEFQTFWNNVDILFNGWSHTSTVITHKSSPWIP